MKIAIAAAILIVAAVIGYIIAERIVARTRLTSGEKEIQRLVREVYGQHITSETVHRESGDAIVQIDLRDEPLSNLQINLSSLARKREEGASEPALKAAMRFSPEDLKSP